MGFDLFRCEMNNWITHYLAAQKAAVDSIPVESVAKLIGILQKAVREDRQIFVFGNGGSAMSPPISPPTWERVRPTRSAGASVFCR